MKTTIARVILILLLCKVAIAAEETSSQNKKPNFVEHSLRLLLKSYYTQILGQAFEVNFLPIAFYDFNTGLNLGLNLQLFHQQKKDYSYRIRLQIISSLKGNHKHKLVFEYPRLLNSNFGLVLRGEWDRDLQTRYFGLGNNSVYNKDFINSQSNGYIHKDFYLYTLKRPRLGMHLTYSIQRRLKFWFGGGFETVEPQLQNDANESFLGLDQPFGSHGGSGKYLSFRLTWDTRDDEVFPMSGLFNEISFEPNFARVNLPEGNSKRVTFNRYTASHSNFLRISKKFILANRLAFEAISGEAPYYAFGDFTGEQRTRAVGGSQSLRGFLSRRFQDKIKMITLTELRFNYRPIEIMSQTLGVIFVAFFDNGRVWNKSSEISLKNFHSTAGLGIWLNLNNNFIIRFDIGHSKEETFLPFLRLNTSF